MPTSRERVLKTLDRTPVDRPPFSLGFGLNPPVRAALMERLGLGSDDRLEGYLLSHSDFRNVAPVYVGPRDRECTSEDGTHTDIWGVKRKPVVYNDSGGSYNEICSYPLEDAKDIADLESYAWPSADWFDYKALPSQIEAANAGGECAIVMGNGNIFESTWYMRGFERTLSGLLCEPELTCAIMDRVTGFFIEYFTKALSVTNTRNGKGNPVDIVFTADDVGGQEGLLFSAGLWREAIMPRHKRLNEVLHGFGAKVMYHSDGAVMELLDGFAEMGIDILEALQFDAKGMSPEAMKRKIGGRLCFHGGISVQSTLPFGTAEDVRREVAERIRVLGEGGGYIIAPSHAIQAGTPVENVLELLKSGKG